MRLVGKSDAPFAITEEALAELDVLMGDDDWPTVELPDDEEDEEPIELGNKAHGKGGRFAPDDDDSPPVMGDHDRLSKAHEAYLSKLNGRGNDTYQTLIAYASDFDAVRRLNNYLRAGESEDKDDAQEQKEFAAVVAKAIKNAPPLPEPIDVFRGIGGWDQGKAADAIMDQLRTAKPGATIKLKGFQSTTLHPKNATNFTGKGKGVLMQIRVKRGLYLGSMSFQGDLHELLLQHGEKYRVIGHGTVRAGKREVPVVKLEQL